MIRKCATCHHWTWKHKPLGRKHLCANTTRCLQRARKKDHKKRT